MIQKSVYQNIIEILPIICVDIIIRNRNDQYLLVNRMNEPMKDKWWVIGGRVLKGETITQAVFRKAREEAGLRLKQAQAIGYFEALDQTDPFGRDNQYHAISIVHEARISGDENIRLDSQSREWKFAESLPEEFIIKPFATK